MAPRIAVDIGGTFTDLLCYDDEANRILVAKVPTTPGRPEAGVADAIRQALPGPTVANSSYFLHGTTVGLNALVERRGAKVGLLTTMGFRDVLELGRASRREMYNPFWSPPAPLVPRRLRLPVRERVNAQGKVLVAMDAADVQSALEIFAKEEVSAIAVVFLHSYANSAHELAVEKIILASGFAGAISLSHRVSGEYRDYERCSTAVIDAFVRARLKHYLNHIRDELQQSGFRGHCLVTRSGGGTLTFDEAQERAFETIMSGPVAGVEGAAKVARSLGISGLLTADVGGTTFDTALIQDGKPHILYQGEINGMPLQCPWVDVRSIGAGGGSIAYVDAGGLLRVGPRSAGAEPGPACYGKGGVDATTTDAAFYLGMLGDGELASAVRLNRTLAERALQPLAAKLNLDVSATAEGIIRIACAAMVGSMREITLERGVDPRELTLLAFGGAGPMLATELARELSVTEVIVPPYAGNFSAWGLLEADLVNTLSRTCVMPLSGESVERANSLLLMLNQTLRESLDRRSESAPQAPQPHLEMRYRGQEHTITVHPKSGTDGAIVMTADELRQLFNETYQATYGQLLANFIEIVAVRTTVRSPLPPIGRPQIDGARNEGGANPAKQSGTAYSLAQRAYRNFTYVQRDALDVGSRMRGPLIVFEPTTTTYVDTDFDLETLPGGYMVLRRRGEATRG
ncbi:MAG: hydantoinase/oxoprolinase family protein [Gammaproteobacteria bacterium]